MREEARHRDQAARPSQRPLGSRLDDMPEFIYQMHAARQAKGDKVLLDDVTLAFFPGAKIGVVGPNGVGKSTLLKTAGRGGAAVQRRGAADPPVHRGLLAQEPLLDETKTVLQNVQEGVAETKALLDATTRSRSRWRPTTPTSCWTRWAGCRRSSITATPGTWTASWNRPWTRCAARRGIPASRCPR